jgi:hypothetical protein
LTVSVRAIAMSSTGHQVFIWMRDRSVAWSMLNRTAASASVAV